MKKEYFGFYQPSNSEIDIMWKKGYYVLDANALLNIYRYSDNTRKDMLQVVDSIKERLFMPYQVGYEFHFNRTNVIEGLKKSYEDLNNDISEVLEKSFKSRLDKYKRHPSLDIKKLIDRTESFKKELLRELSNQKSKHPNFENVDFILEEITRIYENRVAQKMTREELREIYNEGRDRYENKIPPGYKDLDNKKNKGDSFIYGDLIIWKEIIRFSKTKNVDILFITDDRKEDWWSIESGKRIRPREELIKEFYDLTGNRIFIYNADDFLRYAKDRKLTTGIKDSSINEIRAIRKSDEYTLNLAQFLNSDLSKSLYGLTQMGISNINSLPGIQSLSGIQPFSDTGLSSIPQVLVYGSEKSPYEKLLTEVNKSPFYVVDPTTIFTNKNLKNQTTFEKKEK